MDIDFQEPAGSLSGGTTKRGEKIMSLLLLLFCLFSRFCLHQGPKHVCSLKTGFEPEPGNLEDGQQDDNRWSVVSTTWYKTGDATGEHLHKQVISEQ